jgi:hypothetical protein
MSDYEKQIQKNLEDRRKMFEKLVGAAKKDFMGEIVKERKKRATKNPHKKKKNAAKVLNANQIANRGVKKNSLSI